MHSIFEQRTPKNKLKTSKPLPQDAVPSFIRKTYEILEENKFPEYIDWNLEGTAIVIKQPSEFSQKVLPTYFKHNNLTSFVRQLNMYNFHKKRSQNLDHVYFHDLFRRDQKHLLKEIKRKNHENILPNNERSPLQYQAHSQGVSDMFNDGQVPNDINSLGCENAFLKRLYNEAMTKCSMLESQMKEISMQNQSLWNELCQLKGQNPSIKFEISPNTYNSRGNSIKIERGQSEENYDRFQMNMSEVAIPPLKLKNLTDNQQFNHSAVGNGVFVKNPNVNVNGYLAFTEDSTNQSELSYFSGSPSLHNHIESDKEIDNFDQSHSIPKLNQVDIALQNALNEPQNSYKSTNPLKLSRKEVSLGQMFAEWETEEQAAEMLGFSDRKENFDTNASHQGVLGKRGMEPENNEMFSVPEPATKRRAFESLSIFGRKELSSISVDEKDMLQLVNRRESELNDDYDSNNNIDLLDFNNSNLYSWTKTM